MRMSTEALRLAVAVAERCHRPAISDVRVAIGLIRAGLTGAQSSAEANLALMANSPYVEAARAEIEELSLDAVRSADAAEQSLASASMNSQGAGAVRSAPTLSTSTCSVNGQGYWYPGARSTGRVYEPSMSV